MEKNISLAMWEVNVATMKTLGGMMSFWTNMMVASAAFMTMATAHKRLPMTETQPVQEEEQKVQMGERELTEAQYEAEMRERREQQQG